MAQVIITVSKLDNLAEAVNNLTDATLPLTLDQMTTEINNFTTQHYCVPHADIPEYIKSEALSVAKKVAAKQAELNNQITFIAMSDTHYAGEQVDNWQEYSNISTEHAGMAAQILSYCLPIDFACHLGDYTFGSANTTTELLKSQIEKVSQFLDSNFKGIPQFRTVGNHDTGEYGTLVGAEYLYETIGSKCEGATYGSTTYGYCYRDFTDKKVRVICLNTSEGETDNGKSTSEVVSAAQRLWFAQTLYDVGSKADAADWSIIVLGHYCLDFGGAYPLSNIVYAYVNGNSITVNGTTVNFSGNNAASFIADFHGHTHCFKADSLYRVIWSESANANVGEAYDAKRVCVPNVSYYRNNYYGDTSFFGFTYSDDTTYEKTINSGKDTAFVVNVVDLDNKIIHSFCYGAGVDRVISYGSKIYHSINNTLSHVVTDNEATSIEDGAAYTATLTADTGYTLGTVTVTMGGVDITNTAYTDGHISIPSVTGNIVIIATAVKTGYTNQIPLSTDKDGNPYNNGLGYKTGTRINSSANEVAIDGMCCTGFIPLTGKAGDVIRIKNVTYAGTATVYLICFNHNGTPSETFIQSDLETATVDGVTTITTSKNGLISMRLSCGVIDDTSIITINEEIHDPTAYRSITNLLTHVTSSNASVSVEEGAAYTATLSADTGYTLNSVTITMGGTDITSTAYSNGNISIASVTGDIVITAVATKIVSYTNQVPISTDADGNVYNGTGYKDGYGISSSGAEAALRSATATGFIPFTKGQTIRIGGEGITYDKYGCLLMFYDLSKTVIANAGISYDKIGNTTYGTWTTEETSVFCLDPNDTYPNTLSGNSGYIRISANGSGANLIVTLDEKIT